MKSSNFQNEQNAALTLPIQPEYLELKLLSLSLTLPIKRGLLGS